MDPEPLSLVAQLVQEITPSENLDEILKLLYRRLKGVIPFDRIGIAALEDGDKIRLLAAHAAGELHLAPGYVENIKGSTLEQVIHAKKPRIINDLEAYFTGRPHSKSTQLMLKEGQRASLTVPLFLRDQPYGAIFFSTRTAHAYENTHLPIVQTLSGFLSFAVETTKLTRDLRRRSELLSLVFDHSPIAIGMVDEDGVIRSWNRGAEEIFGYAREEIVGHHGPHYLHMFGTIFLFVAFANLLGVIPMFESPTMFPQVPLGVALMTFFYYNIMGASAQGVLGHLKHFCGPVWYLAPLMIPIEIVSHLARPLSLTIRLFANMYAGEQVTIVFLGLVPLIVPTIFMGLHVFVALLQAYIFVLLTMVYVSEAVAHEH